MIKNHGSLQTVSTKIYKLILASQSPRRQEILNDAGFDFTVYPSHSSETFNENMTLEDNLGSIAEEKIWTVLDHLTNRYHKGFIVLSADTTVVLQKQVLGKPKNRKDAEKMLKFMSGKVHTVYTAFSLYNVDQKRGITKLVKTKVGFRKLSALEIQDYLDSGEPFDKAGSYGIQGLGRAFINRVEGDLLNVTGLPINDVRRELRKQRWNVKRRQKVRGRFRTHPKSRSASSTPSRQRDSHRRK